MPDTSVPPRMPLVLSKLLPWCWSSEGVNPSKSMCGSFKKNCLEPQQFPPLTQSPLVFAVRRYGTYLPGTGTLGFGIWCGLRYPLWFLSTTHGCATSLFSVWMNVFLCLTSIQLDFWWLFYILVVILMWLTEEVSCVYLLLHLDWKS